MTIIFIRHGESVNNQPDRSLHTLDPELTARGLLQAELLGERFKEIHLDALICSPIKRAMRTANEIARHKDMPVAVYHDMVEIGTEYLPIPHSEALKICPYLMPYDVPARIGEYGDNYDLDIEDPYYSLSRAYRVISRVRQSFPEEATVALVGHGAFNQRLIAAALRISFPPDYIFSQSNTGVSVVNYRPNEEGRTITRLVVMNDTSHLYGKCEVT